MEIWKEIAGADGYFVSSEGKVRHGERMLKPCKSTMGYWAVWIKGLTRTVHRLVAEAFVPNPDSLPEVDHRDGDKANNTAYNLEWVTRSENRKRAYGRGEKARGGKPKPVTFFCGGVAITFESQSAAARFLGIAQSNVYFAIVHGWNSHGGRFEYA